MIILLDMDGVVADCEQAFRDILAVDFPEKELVPAEDRATFYFEDEHPWLPEGHLYTYMHKEGFFRNLPLIDGAQEGVQRLLDSGAVVKVCTKPVLSPFCVKEKMEWVDEFLPNLGSKNVITTTDKTLIRGDILIDDIDSVPGMLNAEWVHVPFKSGKRNSGTFDWQNMDTVLRVVEIYKQLAAEGAR